jgi:hypothetical protein
VTAWCAGREPADLERGRGNPTVGSVAVGASQPGERGVGCKLPLTCRQCTAPAACPGSVASCPTKLHVIRSMHGCRVQYLLYRLTISTHGLVPQGLRRSASTAGMGTRRQRRQLHLAAVVGPCSSSSSSSSSSRRAALTPPMPLTWPAPLARFAPASGAQKVGQGPRRSGRTPRRR